MEVGLMVAGLVASLAVALAALAAVEHLAEHRRGKLVLFAAVLVLPVVMSGIGIVRGVSRSSATDFCVSCHEMQDYGKSLFVDNPDALSAVHYQKRLISREGTCFACHTNYAMFGDVSAKLNGLKHVWVHYVGGAPDKLELYQPYPNHNCLHCHDDARSFVDVEEHREEMAVIRDGTKSCLECHEVGHDLEGVKAGKFWNAQPR